ncbi:phage portal protein [Candidatus Pacearchaeota archaeon]|nr:phage portal protein [Candidatus Pacearchaeota archaeon]
MSIFKRAAKFMTTPIYLGGKKTTLNAKEVASAIRDAVQAIHTSGSGFPLGTWNGAKTPGGLNASSYSPRLISHRPIRTQARMAYMEVPQARAFVERFADSISGVGLRPEFQPDASILRRPADELDEWGSRETAKFMAYMGDKRQHRAEAMRLGQGQRLYQIGQQRDGENFIRLVYNLQDPTLQSPLQFSFIDPDQIIGDAYTSTGQPFYGKDGIERDSRDREIAYNVRVQDQANKGFTKDVVIPRLGPKSKRIFMLHGYAQEFVGQRRGISRIGHALQEFQKITDFSLATIQKAIAQSAIVAMMENQQQDPSNVLEDIMSELQGQFGANNPVPAEGAQNVTAESLQHPSCYTVPEATITSGGIHILNATKGDTMKNMANTAPGDRFDTFIDAFSGYLTAAGGMPIEVLLMRFNQNYSASRAALILFWLNVEMWRAEMVSDFLAPIKEMWLSLEIAAGRTQAPGWQDPRLRKAWLKGAWIGSALPDIDPSKTAKAIQIRTAMGHVSGTRGALDHNGSSFDANKKRIEKEYGVSPRFSEKQAAGQPDADEVAEKTAQAVIDQLTD